jgi:AraC-like DNA-binding protein
VLTVLVLGAEGSFVVRYSQFDVPPHLEPWVDGVWHLEGDTAAEAASPQRIFPDGCPEIVVHAGPPFLEIGDRGVHRQPAQLIVGQMVRPVSLQPVGRADVWGIRLHPWGAGLVFDGPGAALTGSIGPLCDVSPGLAGALERAICDSRWRGRRLEAICAVLATRALNCRRPDRVAAAAAQRLLRSPSSSVESLAAGAGLSARQLERRFGIAIGLAPMVFARIARFQHIAGLLDAAPDALSAAAVRCGYYDQSHLARDVRAFTGDTPASLKALDSRLTEHFLRAHRTSGFSKTHAHPLA